MRRRACEPTKVSGRVAVHIGQADVTWVVMADPEGNEFCVLRSLADKEHDRSLHGDRSP